MWLINFTNYVIQQDYWSYRDTISLENSYKINSNHNVVFGFEKEFEEMRYNPYDTTFSFTVLQILEKEKK